MKKWASLVLILIVALSLAACGGKVNDAEQISNGPEVNGANQSDNSRDEEFLKKSTHAHLLMTNRKSAEEVRELSVKESDSIRSMAEYVDDPSLKQDYMRVADLIEAEDREGIKAYLREVGIDPEPAREKSNLEKSSDALHQTYAESLLDIAQLYVEASDVSSENRDAIKESFDKNRMGISEEQRSEFEKLGELIKENNRPEATELYKKLRELYD